MLFRSISTLYNLELTSDRVDPMCSVFQFHVENSRIRPGKRLLACSGARLCNIVSVHPLLKQKSELSKKDLELRVSHSVSAFLKSISVLVL